MQPRQNTLESYVQWHSSQEPHLLGGLLTNFLPDMIKKGSLDALKYIIETIQVESKFIPDIFQRKTQIFINNAWKSG